MKKRMYLMLAGLVAIASQVTAQTALTTGDLTTNGAVSVTQLENDPAYPWEVNDGAITSTNATANSNYASFTVSFQSEDDIVCTFNWTNGGSGYDYIYVYRDGSTSASMSQYGNSSTIQSGSQTFFFTPGEHTLRFCFYRYTNSSWANGVTNIGTISKLTFSTLESKFIDINLSAPGTLGLEALSHVDVLTDMRYLRLSGTLNSDDWAQLRNMTNLRALDMTNAQVTGIPASAFSNMGLRYFRYPTVLKTIGEKAFYGAYLLGEHVLPSGVNSIEAYAYYNTSITGMTLPEGVTSLSNNVFYNCTSMRYLAGTAQITSVGSSALSQCTALTTVGDMAPIRVSDSGFSGCTQLGSIDLSRCTTIGGSSFYNCRALTSIDLPVCSSLGGSAFNYCYALSTVNVGDQLTNIESYTFMSCTALHQLTLGASVRSIGYAAFSGCDAIARFYVNSPAPPTCDSGAFSSTNTITLYVPEYATTSYKLNAYWSRFLTVEPNPNPVSSLTLYNALTLTTNARIPGTPDLTLGWASSVGGQLTINGNNAQTVGRYTQYIGQYNYSGSLISRCNSMTAEQAEVRHYCEKTNTYWYYVTMPYDVNIDDVYTRNGAAFACRYYDSERRASQGAGSSWVDVAPGSILHSGQGYIFCVSAADYICLPGTQATRNDLFTPEAITTPLAAHASETVGDANWNLVGNPYPCFYDIYYMDYTAPITVWSTSSKTFTAYSIADDNLALYPLQAFFVQKPTSIEGITFQPAGRQHNTTIEHATAVKAQAPAAQRRIVTLQLQDQTQLADGTEGDRTRVVINGAMTDGFDWEADASKMLSQEAPQLYTLAGDQLLAINEGPQASGQVQLGVWAPAATRLTLSLSRADAQVQLYDNGVAVEMPYTFDIEEGGDDTRFVLAVQPATATGICTAPVADEPAQSAIYDLSGRRVQSAQHGVYIVNGKKVLK